MVVVALMASLTTASQGQADPGPNSEIFTGLEATDNATSGYLGFGYAFGKGLYESGWRLRALGSLGAYDYQGTIFGEGPTTFDGRASFGAAMLGYQLRADTLFLKVFAGVEGEDQDISPRDPDNAVQGSAAGARFVAVPGTNSHLAGSPPPTPPTAPRSSNIGVAGVSAAALARGFRSASRAARSAMRNMTPAAGAPLRSSTYADWRLQSPAASAATISKTNRAATCRSASIALF